MNTTLYTADRLLNTDPVEVTEHGAVLVTDGLISWVGRQADAEHLERRPMPNGSTWAT